MELHEVRVALPIVVSLVLFTATTMTYVHTRFFTRADAKLLQSHLEAEIAQIEARTTQSIEQLEEEVRERFRDLQAEIGKQRDHLTMILTDVQYMRGRLEPQRKGQP